MASKVASAVGEVMTRDVITLEADAPIADAARKMRDASIGDVIVTENGLMMGICTDRDIVVRAIALDLDPKSTALRDVCSTDLTVVPPSTRLDEVVALIRSRAVKRVIIAEDAKPVGIVSIGDLAKHMDPSSALADMSRASPSS